MTIRRIDNGYIIEGVSKEDVVRNVKSGMRKTFPGEEVEGFRSSSRSPMIRQGNNEIVIEVLDNGKVKIVWELVDDEVVDNVKDEISSMPEIDQTVGQDTSDNESIGFPETTDSGEGGGNTTKRVYDDGSIRIVPPFSKREAGYEEDDGSGVGSRGRSCKNCVHYMEGGGCRMVKGDIDANDYCTEFYADFGVFAKFTGVNAEVNTFLWGEEIDIDTDEAEDTLEQIKDRLQEEVDGDIREI